MNWRIAFYTKSMIEPNQEPQGLLRYEAVKYPGRRVHIEYSDNRDQIISPYLYNYSSFYLNYANDIKMLESIKSIVFYEGGHHEDFLSDDYTSEEYVW